MSALFHYAFHVTSLEETRSFYTQVLGCTEGRSTDTWVDFDFYGHQLSLHLGEPSPTTNTGKVGDHLVPMPHFGLILPLDEWQKLAKRLTESNVAFDLVPSVRFEGLPGEQWTMFFKDPSGNAIELKGFKDLAQVYDK
ncbi:MULTISPECIES: VOC family protein [Marinomonas]|uniref:VOC family protein n=1 Tax=Marinomonas arctica TaxID=383750 RepID=A0A7H1J328_9GAMM|nr:MULTISPECIES: VOC family protein [Marinomonas]MCS7485868.1 dioxygenase [Marinomonas sp. BSi20414]QNT04894.1 VOC family protein [Marinomonas arctica]GGN17714.1 dioxygenase [Marinomonas arctica]